MPWRAVIERHLQTFSAVVFGALRSDICPFSGGVMERENGA
tara:strand:- start:1121 stop:1243 length:123 start_codon:yes stop_codon:yes gene_type:complete